MKVLILQHTATEGAGGALDWCAKNKAKITYINLYQPNPQFDSTQKVDLLMILGGPMSVNDEDELPWLKPEKQFVREMIAANTPVLGICLGAQMIATALGVTVGANPETEIGWHPVRNITTDKNVFQLPAEFDVFHWHGETFQLPPNAIDLAQSDACVNQGYQLGDRIIGLQFHPEVTLETIDVWIQNAGDTLNPSNYVQTADEMKSKSANAIPNAHALLHSILDYLVSKK